MRRILNRLSNIIILLFIVAVWLYSFYKVIDYLKLNKIFKIPTIWGIECSFPFCPLPTPPCPPPCPPPCESPTPMPEATPTPTPTPEVTPTPTPTEEVRPTPTPTPAPPIGGNGGPPAGGGGNGGPPGPPTCGALVPSAPFLLSVTKSGNKADLSWTAVDFATHYSILYGESSGNYTYGVDNTGKTTSFNVGGLDPASDYCFAVRAVNDCAPGELSNEICSGEVSVGKVLGVSTLGATGGFERKLLLGFYIIGSTCLLLGIRVSFPRRANLLSQN